MTNFPSPIERSNTERPSDDSRGMYPEANDPSDYGPARRLPIVGIEYVDSSADIQAEEGVTVAERIRRIREANPSIGTGPSRSRYIGTVDGSRQSSSIPPLPPPTPPSSAKQ